jgi:hypothetical protein
MKRKRNGIEGQNRKMKTGGSVSEYTIFKSCSEILITCR